MRQGGAVCSDGSFLQRTELYVACKTGVMLREMSVYKFSVSFMQFHQLITVHTNFYSESLCVHMTGQVHKRRDIHFTRSAERTDHLSTDSYVT